jgi:hypothetical protein
MHRGWEGMRDICRGGRYTERAGDKHDSVFIFGNYLGICVMGRDGIGMGQDGMIDTQL